MSKNPDVGRGEESHPGEAYPEAPSGGPREVDVDRGFVVGLVAGLAMLFLFQGAICGLLQTGVVGGDVTALGPLRYAGLTQFIYIFPSALFFVNRKTPKMAAGLLTTAAFVFVASGISLML